MATTASKAERARDLRELIEGHAATSRVLLSDMQDPARALGEIAHITAQIETLTKDRARRVERLETAKDSYLFHQRRIEDIRKELLVVENEERLERLEKLMAGLHDLGCDGLVEELVAKIKGGKDAG